MLSPMTKSFLDKWRDWDWNLSSVFDYLVQQCQFWIEQIGYMAYFWIFIIIIICALLIPMTQHSASLVVAKLVVGIWQGVIWVVWQVFEFFWMITGRSGVAKTRDSLRYLSTLFSKDK